MNADNKLLCFICNSSFGQSNLETHVIQCKSKAEKSKGKKIDIPDEYNLLFNTFKGGLELEAEDVKNFNYFIQKSYQPQQKTNSLTTSMNKMSLGRGSKSPMPTSKKFGETMGGGFKKTSQSPTPQTRSTGMRPRLLMCPLCGKEYGSLSLPIHMKTCRQKFEIEQMNLPKNMRRSADKIIEQYEKNNMAIRSSDGSYNLDQMNNDAFEIFNKEALVPCEVCGRTFLPDRLLVHLRSCKKKK
jgi:hypothetical protein